MNVLEEAVQYLDRVPKGTAPVKSSAAKEALRGRTGLPHEAAKAWADQHKLTMTTDREDNRVLADTYYFKNK